MSDYAAFLATKEVRASERGLGSIPTMAEHLFPFQARSVEALLRFGSGGLFLDTGLGKTACELEWSHYAAEATNGRALILTPLAVARQIEAEGKRWGYEARVIREQADARPGINVCNYDRLERLEPDAFGAVALDEASILKNFTGATSRSLVAAFARHRFRLSATATPAPNDHTELAQHSAFLGLMARDEMLVRWFINDAGDTKSWRLKGHAVDSFFDWMASWSRMAEHPRDLGDDVTGFDLPALNVHRHHVDVDEGALRSVGLSATSMHEHKRRSAGSRAAEAARLVRDEAEEPWIIWTDTDYEADEVLAAIGHAPDLREVRGSHPIARKEAALADFTDGSSRVLLSKPSVCGFGLNLQRCARVVFVGRSFSYESWYQAVRRCWRFGQKRSVDVHLIVERGEDAIGRVIERKAEDHRRMKAAMVAAMGRAMGREARVKVGYEPTHAGRLPSWLAAHHVERPIPVASGTGVQR